jgi:hypothetical protein
MTRPYLPEEIDQRVRAAAQNRCGYCLSPQHLVMARLEIEHIIPLAHGGSTDEANLWLACPLCNRYKGDKTSSLDPATGLETSLFNPRTQKWSDHFRWSPDGVQIIGLTATGRATVSLLHLGDDPTALEVRSYWVAAGWHPPEN